MNVDDLRILSDCLKQRAEIGREFISKLKLHFEAAGPFKEYFKILVDGNYLLNVSYFGMKLIFSVELHVNQERTIVSCIKVEMYSAVFQPQVELVGRWDFDGSGNMKGPAAVWTPENFSVPFTIAVIEKLVQSNHLVCKPDDSTSDSNTEPEPP